jgi:hypothetical protein
MKAPIAEAAANACQFNHASLQLLVFGLGLALVMQHSA